MEEVDALLVRRVATGDRQAFDELYERNAGWLVARLRRRCGDPEVAAELLQETFSWSGGRPPAIGVTARPASGSGRSPAAG